MAKVYVEVDVKFLIDGQMRPIKLYWQDGRSYEIQKVLDVRPAASMKAGGAGIRYTCIIEGTERPIWLEESRWFVEGKDTIVE